MKKFHPFFIIGTLGMIITASLHMLLALGLSISSVHVTFYMIYPTFLSFMMLGFGLTLKNQKETTTNI